jgi:cysteine sulfinate desulfinase/cysteine desulfurase-like protein
MGIGSADALCAVRVSFGPGTQLGDLESFAEFLKKEIPALMPSASRSGR